MTSRLKKLPRVPRLRAVHPHTNGSALPAVGLVKLDLGAGRHPKEGFLGVDAIKFPETAYVVDLAKPPWPWPDSSIDEVNSSHFVEHLDFNRHNPERVRFMNELWRVLKPGAKATIVTPHWCSNRAYGDFTHADKPVAEMFFYYISREWRKREAPHTDIEFNPQGFSCDFAATWGHSFGPELAQRAQEYQTFALQNYKEAALDLVATLTAQK